MNNKHIKYKYKARIVVIHIYSKTSRLGLQVVVLIVNEVDQIVFRYCMRSGVLLLLLLRVLLLMVVVVVVV